MELLGSVRSVRMAVRAGGRGTDERGSLRVVVVTDVDELAGLTPQWERLLASAYRPTEFNTPAAVLTWYRWFSLTSGVYALTVWRGNDLVGLAPLSVTRLGLPVVGFHLYNTVGAEHSYHGEPLLAAEPAPVARAIADHVTRLVSAGTAVVNFRRLWSDGPMANALGKQPGVVYRQTGNNGRTMVRFDEMTDPEAYFAHVGRKQQIPRRSRRLTERFNHIEYLPVDPDPDAALDAMADMLRRRFDPGTGPAEFATPGREAFTRALTRQMLATDNARLSSLVADGQRIAVVLIMHVGSRAFWCCPAYEPRLMDSGIGHLELYETLRNLHAEGISEVDLGSARFQYKHKWSSSTIHYCSITVTAGSWRRRLAPVLARAAASRRFRRLRHVSSQ